MRYRPFGRSGVTTSALALDVTDEAGSKGANALKDLIFTALEAGMNTYHISGDDPDLPRILGEALLSHVDRRMVFVSQDLGVGQGRIGKTRDFSPAGLTKAVDTTLQSSALGHLDLVVLEDPSSEELPRASLTALKGMRSSGRVTMIGVAGANDAMDAYISTGAFDVLMTSYHLRSGWKERNRLKAAVDLDMGVIAHGWFPEELSSAKKTETMATSTGPGEPKRGLFGNIKQAISEPTALQGAGTYNFLHKTKNWTAEEICLSYALTEPALSSILIRCTDPAHLSAIAAVPDRDMPPGLAAQIEMARFSPGT
jgi:aryl-alcohol dehydrogenase-like predicted oxidoreductase